MSRFCFKPPLWSVTGLLPALAVMLWAGFWQLDKGLAKAALAGQMQAAAGQPRLEVDASTPAPDSRSALPARVSGRFEGARQLLLDNQSHQRRPGYRVWTPLRLDATSGGRLVMVDRGWVPLDGARRPLAELGLPAGAGVFSGLWRPLPEPGLRLEPAGCRVGGVWPHVVQYPDAATLECLYGESVVDGLLLLDPAEPGGYVREWSPVREIPASRHYGYAAQWFGFAATLLFFFIKLNLQRLP